MSKPAPSPAERCAHHGNHGYTGCTLAEGHAGHHRNHDFEWAWPFECGHTAEQHKWGGDSGDCLGFKPESADRACCPHCRCNCSACTGCGEEENRP
jgi:hypothetical protein